MILDLVYVSFAVTRNAESSEKTSTAANRRDLCLWPSENNTYLFFPTLLWSSISSAEWNENENKRVKIFNFF